MRKREFSFRERVFWWGPRTRPCLTPPSPGSLHSFVWRRGSVPIWWGVEIKNSGVGEAEIWINASHTYRGSGTYFKRLQHRYVPRVTIAREVSPGRDKAGPASGASAAAVPVTCINLLRCAMGKSEMLLSEHFHEAVRRIRKSDQERQLMVLNFDWHSTVKSLGEVSAVEGLWSLLGSIQPQYDVSAGVMGPEKDIKASYPSATGSTSPWPDGWAVHWLRQQYGILRFNCADSLDRTNVASYFAATEALVEQAKVCGLNILGRPTRHLAQTSPTPGRSPSTGALSKVTFTLQGNQGLTRIDHLCPDSSSPQLCCVPCGHPQPQSQSS